MANVLIDENTLQNIANKTRALSGSENPMTMDEANESLANTKQTLDTTLEEIKEKTNTLSDNYQIEKLSKYLEYDEENDRYILDLEKHAREYDLGGKILQVFCKYVYIDSFEILSFNIKINDNYLNFSIADPLSIYCIISMYDKNGEIMKITVQDLLSLSWDNYEKLPEDDDITQYSENVATLSDISDIESEFHSKPGEIVKNENGIPLGEKFNNAKEASGQYSHAEGNKTTASGYDSHAEGSNTTASGDYSHAEGSHTTASAHFSHSEGGDTTASGDCSHAEGDGTTASGQYSHAEGQNTTASGPFSHAEGQRTTASGSYSHAEGQDTTAVSYHQHVQGKYNIEDTENKYAHIVGNGTTDANRSNANVLDWKGNSEYKGDVIAKSPCDGTTSDEQVSLVDTRAKIDQFDLSHYVTIDGSTKKIDLEQVGIESESTIDNQTYKSYRFHKVLINQDSNITGYVTIVCKNLESNVYINAPFVELSLNYSEFTNTINIYYYDSEGYKYRSVVTSEGSTETTSGRYTTDKEVLKLDNEIEYNPTENYHPATKKYVDDKALPTVTAEDNGKILKVVDGKWALVSPDSITV